MRVLIAHNAYQQVGGEDQCVAAEIDMLEAQGHEVVTYRLSNDAVEGMGRLNLGLRTVWSRDSYRALRALCRTHRPHVAHFHNILPLISPAAYYAARAEGVAVVQTLHNFRIACVNALLFREGRICLDCLPHAVPWKGVTRGCYRGSRAASAAIATMIGVHRALGTWREAVDAYIALSKSSRGKLVQAGLPAERITIKPNFVYPDPGPGTGGGGYALYVGRLSAEKGLPTLLDAWHRLDGAIPLTIVGDGPMAPMVRRAAEQGGITWLHTVPHAQVHRLIGEASFLVLPSLCFENLPRVVVEAYASGTPAIVSRLGAMGEIVEDGHTGSHFTPGDAVDLATKVRSLLADPTILPRMRIAARRTFEREYTAEANHAMLMQIYNDAIAKRLPSGRTVAETAVLTTTGSAK